MDNERLNTLTLINASVQHVKTKDEVLVPTVKIVVDDDTPEFKAFKDTKLFTSFMEVSEIRPVIGTTKSKLVFNVSNMEYVEAVFLNPIARSQMNSAFKKYLEENDMSLDNLMDEALEALGSNNDVLNSFAAKIFQSDVDENENNKSIIESSMNDEELTDEELEAMLIGDDSDENYALYNMDEDYTDGDVSFAAFYHYFSKYSQARKETFEVELEDALINVVKTLHESKIKAPFALVGKDNEDVEYFAQVNQIHMQLLGSQEYYDSISLFDQKLTGFYQLSVSGISMNERRGKVVNLVFRIANGDASALVEAYGLMNKISEANSKFVRRRAGDFTAKMTYEENELHYFMEAVHRLWAFLSPMNIGAIIQENVEPVEYIESVQELKSLFDDDQLKQTFDSIIEEFEGDILNFLVPPTKESDVNDIMKYYSSRLTKTNLPEKMRPLLRVMSDFPMLYEHNWVSTEVGIEETPENYGEIVVAKLITIAQQYSRLMIIKEETSSNINPIGCIIRGLTSPDESLFWIHSEGVTSLIEDDDTFVFEQIYGTGIGLGSSFEPELMLNTSLSFLLHRTGHSIIESDMLDTVPLLALDLPMVSEYLKDLKEFTEVAMNSDDESDFSELLADGCPPIIAAYKMFSSQHNTPATARELSREFGKFLINYAKTHAAKHCQSEEGSDEYQAFLKEFMSSLLLPSKSSH